MNTLLFLVVFIALVIIAMVRAKPSYAQEPAHEGLDLNDLEPAMKTKILPKLIDVTNERNFIRNELRRRGQVERVGKEYEVKYMTAKSEGFGSRHYNELFQRAGQSQYRKGKSETKNIFGRIRVWGADTDYTNAEYKAVVNAVTREIQSYGEAYGTNMTRIMCWDGGIEPLCVVQSAEVVGDKVVCTLDAPYTTKWLRIGMPIEFRNADGNLIATAGAQDQDIVNVLDDHHFTFVPTDWSVPMHPMAIVGQQRAALCQALATSKVYRNGTYGKDPYGMWALFGKMDNMIGDIDRSNDDNWWARPQVYRKAASGNGIQKGERAGTPKDWNLANLRKFENVLTFQGGASKSDLVFFSTSDVADYYIELWANRGGYHEQGPKVDAWPYRKVYFDGIPWLVDDYFLDNVIFGGDFSQLVEYRCREMHWENKTGKIWHWIHGYDCWEAFTVERVNYGALDYTKTGALWDLKGYSEMSSA